MGLFEKYDVRYTDQNGNYHKFIPQYIRARVNGVINVHTCLYRIIYHNSCVNDESMIQPQKRFLPDLGIDTGFFLEILLELFRHVIFESEKNSFSDWFGEICDRLKSDDRGVDDMLQTMTVAQLEEKINAGNPKCAARYEG